jgi:hypothetical protein
VSVKIMNSLTSWDVVQILVFQDLGFNFFSPTNFRFIYIYSNIAEKLQGFKFCVTLTVNV